MRVEWTVLADDDGTFYVFVFARQRLVVFVDGCFWHGCKCKRLPKANQSFWLEKIRVNRARDKRIARQLRASGWRVIRLWEHQLKNNPGRALRRIAQALHRR